MADASTWSPSSLTQSLVVVHVGIAGDDARIYLTEMSSQSARFVIRLIGLYKLFHRLNFGVAVDILETGGAGWLGFELSGDVFTLTLKEANGNGLLIAVACEIEYGFADTDEVLNWPG